MTTPDVLVSKDGSIATITLNRPDKRNAQGIEFTPTLLAALDEVETAPEIRVAILTGNGPVFGGGGDLNEIMSTEETDPEWEFDLVLGYNRLISRIYHFDRPIIAAVNGPAVGGGTCLALACDFAIASDAAAYHFAFSRIGLSAADMGAPTLLLRALGAPRAHYYLQTGGVIDAELGRELGLFVDVVPPSELLNSANRAASSIAKQSRRGSTITKTALRRGAETSFDASLEYEAYLQCFAFRSREHKARLGQFLDKSNASRG
ncbi:2-(1,2-epoxy-1,2-dihydrophenyl)acetyl-CoA isomerase [Sulfitobacter sp. KE34]|uniref:enoyl-CoA hydratase/isomerase family protein n=1 Tax=unclassified Sulfitobacter TaxID=196795 RepID=UPI001447D5D3|nr:MULTISPECIES: enoyl-CoA hydratase-related protein [unclassified Sulfitobacter]NKX40254.1 2-(1,2-epoxy-1,2-dihydrophenyl)acetyl-CoA isomerase [Rhodobacteraceae bacterium R_SAG2]MDF3351625.1 2-(1,2-epoxy-1,2-dihydrophenyl)acetyl-CoA isomerase [Sulfitobacter sp. KE12]MDF3355298.1 2-(1,2-epoxy-1,2-dihydrophenyl)acetyl-CoA isomerase [Sulfitobacter sp. KE27]MDF3358946.1 2-(1,2-epoxy-1,2-dihydrophenyl)acetyl-CoA isomerase [Sulfitobacter sp. KE33]MDF3366370.1 2-(1,2-epoxy-1,2-dihydrophenyl)acetyl-C|tara:strand:+ start:455 stop:1240 length:786 start_codon:yes stop_codon:yes gene_type:complete